MSAHRSLSHGPVADRVSSRHRRCGTARDFAGRRAVSSAGSTPAMADENDAHLEPGDEADTPVAPSAPGLFSAGNDPAQDEGPTEALEAQVRTETEKRAEADAVDAVSEPVAE